MRDTIKRQTFAISSHLFYGCQIVLTNRKNRTRLKHDMVSCSKLLEKAICFCRIPAAFLYVELPTFPLACLTSTNKRQDKRARMETVNNHDLIWLRMPYVLLLPLWVSIVFKHLLLVPLIQQCPINIWNSCLQIGWWAANTVVGDYELAHMTSDIHTPPQVLLKWI